jgi:hypothetical protein
MSSKDEKELAHVEDDGYDRNRSIVMERRRKQSVVQLTENTTGE